MVLSYFLENTQLFDRVCLGDVYFKGFPRKDFLAFCYAQGYFCTAGQYHNYQWRYRIASIYTIS